MTDGWSDEPPAGVTVRDVPDRVPPVSGDAPVAFPSGSDADGVTLEVECRRNRLRLVGLQLDAVL